jgi:hypothetical protein
MTKSVEPFLICFFWHFLSRVKRGKRTANLESEDAKEVDRWAGAWVTDLSAEESKNVPSFELKLFVRHHQTNRTIALR